MNRLLALVAVLATAGTISAQGPCRPASPYCPPPVRYAPRHVAPPVAIHHQSVAVPAIPVVQTIAVPTPAVVFQFLGAYTPPAVFAIPTAPSPGVSPPAAPRAANDWPSALPAPAPTANVHEGLLVLRDNCARCHQAPERKGGIQFLDATGQFTGDADMQARILVAIEGANGQPPTMPKGASPLLDSAKAKVRMYFQS